MKINRNNYEEFILDYYDGNLNPDQVSELFLFLKENPDKKEEFDSFENLSLVADENIVFSNKESLKKKDIIPIGSIDAFNYEMFFIADLENDLTEKEAKDVQLFLERNPHLTETFHLIKIAKLRPDTSIVFENKESLKKKEIIPVGSINHSNYKSFFIADFEKDLTKKEAQDLEQFLSMNDHLFKEYNIFKQTRLIPDTSIVFENKESLKKKDIVTVGSINQSNYETFFIAAVEKDLTLAEAHNLEQFLSENKHLCKEYNLYEQTKLTPDTSIVFENKTALKKFVITPAAKKKSYSYQYISIAASILILFGIFFLVEQNKITILTADNNPAIRQLFDYSLSTRQPNIGSNNNNELTTPDKSVHSNTNNNYNLKTIHASQISYIPLQGDDKNNITAFRGSGEPITFNNDLLADNSNLPKNTGSEPLTVKEFLINKFRKNVNKSNEELNQPADRLTGWDIAQAGVAGINKLTNSDFELKKDATNPENSYALIGKNFTISKNFNDK